MSREGINRVILFGTLGADPDLRMTSGGQAICTIRLVTNERFKKSSGEWGERSEWHRVKVWGKQGEACANNLAKGSSLFVEGRIETKSYDKGGEKRYTTDIVAEKTVFVGGSSEARGDGGGRGDRRQRGQSQPRRVSQEDMKYPEEGDGPPGGF